MRAGSTVTIAFNVAAHGPVQLFAEATRPMIDRYEQRGILVTVDGTCAVDELTSVIQTRLAARVG